MDEPITIIGIDIGLKGAIAVLNSWEQSSDADCDGVYKNLVFDMPTITKQTTNKKGKVRFHNIYNSDALCKIFHDVSIRNTRVVCFIEKALIVSRHMNIKTNTGLARCEGIFEGITAAFRIPTCYVEPKDWENYFDLRGKKKDGDSNVQLAKSKYPDIKFQTPRGRVLDGRADAMLIAEYGKQYAGILFHRGFMSGGIKL